MLQLKTRAFTLIELMVVMSIVSLLSSLIYSSVATVQAKSRDALRISQLYEVEKALALYYSNHGNYPREVGNDVANDAAYNWKNMMTKLRDDNLIQVQTGVNQYPSRYVFISIKKAYAAAGGPIYHYCSIQDPLYKAAEDYNNSYSYQSSDVVSPQAYRIRIRLEQMNHPIFSRTITGKFLGTDTTGYNACDPTLGYFCSGQGNF